ncbi:MAG TPA: FtsX-like permease family protein, partial [Acidimicrobiales bacterium]|nr:FtsX-like permease family protein [Acidimicrobiales bacterium]
MSTRQLPSVHRAAARLAGRELRRRPWRTTLVVLLVALPVAAMVLAASLLRTTKPSFDLEDRSLYGLADVVVPQRYGPPGEPVEDIEQVRRRVLAVAPGARIAEVEEVTGAVQGPTGKPRYIGLLRATDDPIVAPRTTVRSGRLPRNRGEVAISPQLARGWHVGVGSTLDLAQLGLQATVVGIAHPLTGARSDTLYVGQMPDLATDQGGRSLFIDLPGDDRAVEATIGALGSGGPLSVPTRYAAAVYGPRALPDRDAEVLWSTVVGALALAVLGVVIAAAFAVGARRQLRTLGILASNGASPAALRAVVLWQGAWSGILGSAAGLALGALGLAAPWPHHDRFLY